MEIDWGLTWSMATAISTAFVAVGALFAGCVARRQLQSLVRNMRLSAFSAIVEEFQSPELGQDRRTVYTNDFADPKNVPECQLYAARRVLVSFTKIGFLVQQGFIQLDSNSVDIFGPPAIKTWDKLKTLVICERERRREPGYARFLEELACRCRSLLRNYEPRYFRDDGTRAASDGA